MDDKIILEIFVKTAKASFSMFWKVLTWLRFKNREIDFLGKAARNYTDSLKKRYNYIRVLGMNEPIPLRNVYVRVNILKKIRRRQPTKKEQLEKLFDRDKRKFGLTQSTISGTKAVNTYDRIIVLGKPGSGKTTFLKYLILNTIDGNVKDKRVPVFISLKDYSKSNFTLIDFIVKQFDICKFPNAKPFIKKILEDGNCQLLLDGLDEVDKKNQEIVIREILDLSDKYNKNQYVISCRIAAYNHWFEKFVDIEMADFNKRQIISFINNWFDEDRRIAQLCWRELNGSSHIRELATTPLFLSLLCLAFKQNYEFPNDRTELYKEALDALLKKWDKSRLIFREEIYKNLSNRRKEAMFSLIAAESFQNSEYFLSQEYLQKKITNYLINLEPKKVEKEDPDGEKVLRAIEAQHGIFVKRAKGIYSFSHLTFQEYYTARYIRTHAREGTLESLVENIFDDRWREVFLLTTGMLDEADDFLLLMHREIQSKLKNKELHNLKTLANEIISELSKSPRSIASIVALIRLMHIILEQIENEQKNIDKNVIRDINATMRIAKNLAKKLAVQMDVQLSLYSNRTKNVVHSKYLSKYSISLAEKKIKNMLNQRYSYSKTLDKIWDKKHKYVVSRAMDRASDRNVEMHLLSKKLAELDSALKTYLKAKHLLIDCLLTECYVSKSVRNKILAELF